MERVPDDACPSPEPRRGDVAELVDLRDRSEVAEEQHGSGSRSNPLDALDAELDVDVRRGGGRLQDPDVGEMHPQRVAGEEGAGAGVDETDVVGGVSRRVEDLEGAITEVDPVALGDGSNAILRRGIDVTE